MPDLAAGLSLAHPKHRCDAGEYWSFGMRFVPICFVLASAAALVGCPDATPGSPDGAGGSGNGGGSTGGAGGGIAGAPNFANATPVELESPGGRSADEFGWAVATSGDTVVVGAYRDYSSLIVGGAVHVFVRDGDGYAVQTSLRAQPAEANSFFGSATSISGDVLWSGAQAYSEPLEVAGAAYVMTRNGDSWVSQQFLQQDPPETYGKFGNSVAVSGSTAVIGAPTLDGKAFVYESTGGDWTLTSELVADESINDFGYAVAIDGDTALVGTRAHPETPSTVFVFVRDGRDWVQQAKLVAGNGGADFGSCVSLSGNTAVVGSDLGAANAAYVFVRTGTTWTQEAELTADDGAQDDAFGSAVAVSGNVAVVGAPDHDGQSLNGGGTYVFARSAGDWSQQTKLLQPGGDDDARFGVSVAIDGPVAVVGAVNDATGTGSATIYRAE